MSLRRTNGRAPLDLEILALRSSRQGRECLLIEASDLGAQLHVLRQAHSLRLQGYFNVQREQRAVD